MKKFKKIYPDQFFTTFEIANPRKVLENLQARISEIEHYLLQENQNEEPKEPCRHENFKRTYYTIKSNDNVVYQCANDDCKNTIDLPRRFLETLSEQL